MALAASVSVRNIRDRMFRSRSATPIDALAERPTSYRHWTEESMKSAYTAVMNNELSIRQAASAYSIPYTTLCDRVSGRVKFGAHSGPERHLSDSEEKELVRFLSGAAGMGFARSKKEVFTIVEAVLASKGKAQSVSSGWWESFNRRHPHLSIRKAEKLSYARSQATDPIVLDNYYDLLERTLEEYDLFDDPTRIFNCDETGVSYQHTPPHVVAVKGQRHPRSVTTGNKKNVTVLACANAAGYFLPPLVIFKRKTLPLSMLDGEVPGTLYSLSDSSWMDSNTFDHWFANHFLVHVPPVRPLMLLLDGHSTHYNPVFIRKAASEGIVVFCFPPNMTHLLQPLDKGIFGPFKCYWNEECHLYMRTHPGQVISDYSFNTVFGRAWGRSMTIPNAAAAFHTTGIYPFDRTRVSAVDNTSAVVDVGKLHYIPVLSPVPPRRRSAALPYKEPLPLTCNPDKENDDSIPSNLLLNDIPTSQSVISRFFPDCSSDIRPPRSYDKTCAKVLTGAEFRKEQEEKERLKKQKEQEANEKKKKRDAKKAASKASKSKAKKGKCLIL